MHAIQVDPTTYTASPAPEERYNEWLTTFDLEISKGAISELLVSNVEVRALYTQLVSDNFFYDSVSHTANAINWFEARISRAVTTCRRSAGAGHESRSVSDSPLDRGLRTEMTEERRAFHAGGIYKRKYRDDNIKWN